MYLGSKLGWNLADRPPAKLGLIFPKVPPTKLFTTSPIPANGGRLGNVCQNYYYYAGMEKDRGEIKKSTKSTPFFFSKAKFKSETNLYQNYGKLLNKDERQHTQLNETQRTSCKFSNAHNSVQPLQLQDFVDAAFGLSQVYQICIIKFRSKADASEMPLMPLKNV